MSQRQATSDSRRWASPTVLELSVAGLSLDTTIVGAAQPTVQRVRGANHSHLGWIVSADLIAPGPWR